MLISNSSLIRPNKQFRCRNQLSMKKETPYVLSSLENISDPKAFNKSLDIERASPISSFRRISTK